MDGWWTLAAGDIELAGWSVTRRDGYQGMVSPPIVDPEAIVQLPFSPSRL
jgi:hypothetical protein